MGETSEILQAEDAELNKVVGLGKLAPYSKALVDPERLSRKRKRLRSAMRERQIQEAEMAAKAGRTIISANQETRVNEIGAEVKPETTTAHESEPSASNEKRKRKRRKSH